MMSISNNTGMAWGCCQRNRKCGKCNEQNPDFLSAARGHEAVIAEFTKLSLRFEWWPISYRLQANGLITCQLWAPWPIKAGIHVEPVNTQVFYYLILLTKNHRIYHVHAWDTRELKVWHEFHTVCRLVLLVSASLARQGRTLKRSSGSDKDRKIPVTCYSALYDRPSSSLVPSSFCCWRLAIAMYVSTRLVGVYIMCERVVCERSRER